ncbi:MAG: hypothetical protein R6U98_13460 [Pirellulaceae bacterium]
MMSASSPGLATGTRTDRPAINHTDQRIVELNQNRGFFELPSCRIRESRVERDDAGSNIQTVHHARTVFAASGGTR